MRKIEILQKIDDNIGVITRYPRWMKWLMKFVEFYIIPDITDSKLKINLKDTHKFYELSPPTFKYRIGALT